MAGRTRYGGGSWTCVGLLSVGLLAGCAQNPGGAVQLAAQTKAYAVDLPLPEGFWLVEGKSTENFRAGRRQGLCHVYRGPADKSAVREFYREQMPLVRWVLESEQLEGSVYTMRFSKAGEACEITISNRPELLLTGSQVQAVISTRSRDKDAPKKGTIP